MWCITLEPLNGFFEILVKSTYLTKYSMCFIFILSFSRTTLFLNYSFQIISLNYKPCAQFPFATRGSRIDLDESTFLGCARQSELIIVADWVRTEGPQIRPYHKLLRKITSSFGRTRNYDCGSERRPLPLSDTIFLSYEREANELDSKREEY